MTCVENLEIRLDQAIADGFNSCPPDRQCMTYEEVFGNGTRLCNTLWGDSYDYSEDEGNCTVMAFDRDWPNPNFQLSIESAGGQMEASITATAIVLVWVI